MKVTDRAVLYARKFVLSEMEVEYEEVDDLETLRGSMVTGGGKTRMIVNARLAPVDRIRLAFHMLAHRELGHVGTDLGARLEFVAEDAACLTAEFMAQEEDADGLAHAWLRGKELPAGLRALSSSSAGASLRQRFWLQVLAAIQCIGHAARGFGVVERSGITAASSRQVRSWIDRNREAICLRHMECVGRQLYPTLENQERERRERAVPSSRERLEFTTRIAALAGGKSNDEP
jgi:hypothetical protein